ALTGTQAGPAPDVHSARSRRGTLAAMLPAIVVGAPLVLFVLFPLSHILSRSFSTAVGFGFGNYAVMLGNQRFLRITYASFGLTLVSTAIAVLLAYAFAYAI